MGGLENVGKNCTSATPRCLPRLFVQFLAIYNNLPNITWMILAKIGKRFVQILPRHINPKKIVKDMAKMCAAFLLFFKNGPIAASHSLFASFQ